MSACALKGGSAALIPIKGWHACRMVATMAMYGAHSIVSAVVAHKAHSARQVLHNGSVLDT